jgi:hypothetical protein
MLAFADRAGVSGRREWVKHSRAFFDQRGSIMIVEPEEHHWLVDSLRTRFEIGVIVYRCTHCGSLQIKNGGPDAPSVYKPGDPGWNPFRTMKEAPPCKRVNQDFTPQTATAQQ